MCAGQRVLAVRSGRTELLCDHQRHRQRLAVCAPGLCFVFSLRDEEGSYESRVQVCVSEIGPAPQPFLTRTTATARAGTRTTTTHGPRWRGGCCCLVPWWRVVSASGTPGAAPPPAQTSAALPPRALRPLIFGSLCKLSCFPLFVLGAWLGVLAVGGGPPDYPPPLPPPPSGKAHDVTPAGTVRDQQTSTVTPIALHCSHTVPHACCTACHIVPLDRALPATDMSEQALIQGGGGALRSATFRTFPQFRNLSQFSPVFPQFSAIFLTCPSYMPPFHVAAFSALYTPVAPAAYGSAIFPQCSATFPQFSTIGFDPPRLQSPPPCLMSLKTVDALGTSSATFPHCLSELLHRSCTVRHGAGLPAVRFLWRRGPWRRVPRNNPPAPSPPQTHPPPQTHALPV